MKYNQSWVVGHYVAINKLITKSYTNYIKTDAAINASIIDGSTARRCIAIVTNERRASYVIPLNSSWESRLKTP